MANLKTYWQSKCKLIDRALDQFIPKPNVEPTRLHQAMRYSVFGNGKRVRPILTLAVTEMLGGAVKEALIPACAIELIHSYSLIHDDLPCMDDDDYRRGKPSCHKKFGEVEALLAGDSLLTLAFEILASSKSKHSNRLSSEIGRAAGTQGMIGGQMLDIIHQDKELNLSKLDAINRLKTGALLQVSCVAGAISAGASKSVERRILKFGEYLGFAFQVVDDILDHDGYLRVMSEEKVRKKAEHLIEKAKKELQYFGRKAFLLNEMTNSLLNRRK